MKIGILTFQETTNFGALLQATALQKAILKCGCNSEIIDYKCQSISQRELPKSFTRMSIKRFPQELVTKYFTVKKYRKMESFKKEHLQLSAKQYTKETISQTNLLYDRFLAGSDMIWNLEITGGDTSYYLEFVSDDEKKYAFSSSFGYDEVPGRFVECTSNLLRKFSGITVREDRGAAIVKKLIGHDVAVTVDPTLLLNRNEWREYEESYPVEKQYVLVYFNDNEGNVLRFAQERASENGWEVFFLTTSIRPLPGVKKLADVSVGQFLWLIHHAAAVVTASYHGVLFSINYHVPFYYYNRTHFGRIETIIQNCNIHDRNISEAVAKIDDIDWKTVDQRINEMRDQSLQYLNDILDIKKTEVGNNISSIAHQDCCGCTGCAAICPKNAITMKSDGEGFLYPSIDQNKCVGCGLCIQVCRKIPECQEVISSYAARNTSDEVLKRSSSGGVSHALYKKIIQNNGVVYGVAWNDDHVAVMKRAECLKECDAFFGSKYVQVDPGNSFRRVREDLINHRVVLFIGTSCLVGGLLSYLNVNKCDVSALYTVDMICHGVPSPGLFSDYIKYLKGRIHDFDHFDFRTKELPWGNGSKNFGSTIFRKSGKKETNTTRSRMYLKLFFSNNCLRPHCHHCEYASACKPADITIADYWGIMDAEPEFYDKLGVSAVLVHTDKGKELLSNSDELILRESSIEKIERKQANLHYPSPIGSDREKFWAMYRNKGFHAIAKAYGGDNLREKAAQSRLYQWLKHI